MTKEEAKTIIIDFFKEVDGKQFDAFTLPALFQEARTLFTREEVQEMADSIKSPKYFK